MNKRDQLKEEYQKYREVAMDRCKDTSVKILPTANVQVLENGAFVEAMIWVPKEEL